MLWWNLLGCISDMGSLTGTVVEGVLGAGIGEDMMLSTVREDELFELAEVSVTGVNCGGAGESLLLCCCRGRISILVLSV